MTEYLIPATITEALALLAQHSGEALLLAGGTDVLPDIRKGRKNPRYLVDVSRMAELGGIEETAEHLLVGAATTLAALKEHALIRQRAPALAEAAASVGAQGIQNAATWGGNLVQAMPAADGAIVALALDAEAEIVDGGGAVWRPVETLFVGPGRSAIDPTRQLLARIKFAAPAVGWGCAWQRVGRRASLVLPIINCAVTVRLVAGQITAATIALGPVAPVPFRARQAEAFLTGKEPATEMLVEAGRIARQESEPRTSIMRASREYRLAIIPVLVRDALQQAVARVQNADRT